MCVFSQCSNIHPVFISKFKILSDPERNDSSDSKEDGETAINAILGKDVEERKEGNVEPFLDEDGDLDITHRYGNSFVNSLNSLS